MEELKVQEIKCEAFLDTKKVIEKVEEKINSVRNTKERQDYFQDILSELNASLVCSKYNVESSDCQRCRDFSIVKKENTSSLLKNVKQPNRFYYESIK